MIVEVFRRNLASWAQQSGARYRWFPAPALCRVLIGATLFLTACADVDPTRVPLVTAEPGTPLYHAQQCAQELGPIPGFSCSDALEIPVTVNGKRVFEDQETCDRPAAFAEPCDVGNRVGRKQGTHFDGRPRSEVMYVTFCRDGGMGVIGHNAETGATCFFSVEETTDAFGVVPGQHDPGYDEAWQAPEVVAKDGCVDCHHADPFLHSPWIDQVRDPHNPSEPLVPAIASATSPYFVVGDVFPQPKFADLPGNACTHCHRGQCTPSFFNVDIGALHMPGPFEDLRDESAELGRYRRRMADARDELQSWCASVGLDKTGK